MPSASIASVIMPNKWRSIIRGIVAGPPVLPRCRGQISAFIVAVTVLTLVMWALSVPLDVLREIGADESQKGMSQSPPMPATTTELFGASQEPHNFTPCNSLEDYSRLINITNFNFVINHFPCNNSVDKKHRPLVILILVHSDPNNLEKRQVIRETWGSRARVAEYNVTMNLVFLLGEVANVSLQQRIKLEDQLFGDIVQGHFLDSYRNMTYKHVMGLKWSACFCRQATYVLKTDDDIFVNTPALIRFLTIPREDKPIKPKTTKFILCNRIDKARVKRSYRSKWHVTHSEYAKNVYPAYCMGCAILYSYDVVTQLYRKAQFSPYFWIDDVHITGTLLKELNLTHTHVGELMLTQWQVDNIISNPVGGSGKNLFFHFLKDSYIPWGKGKDPFLFGTELGSSDIRKLWRIVNADT